MSLFRRGGVWYTRIKAGGQWVKETTNCTDKRAAEAVHVERQRCAADPTYRATNATTLGELIMGFLGAEEVQARAKGTQEMYEQKCRHLARVMGQGTPASQVSAATVDAYCEQRLAEGAKRNTIAKELIALRGVLRLALRRGQFSAPLESVLPKWDALYEPRTTHLTRQQLDKLLAELPEHRANYVRFAVACATRHAETMAAQPGDIRDTHVYVRSTKTRRKGYGDRPVPITDLTRDLLERVTLPIQRWPDGNRKRDLDAACKRAGIPRVTANDLRRTHATWLAEAGVNDSLAGRVLGHGSAEMVRRVYGRLSAETLSAAVQVAVSSGTLAGQSNAEKRAKTNANAYGKKQKTPAFTGETLQGLRGSNPRPADLESARYRGDVQADSQGIDRCGTLAGHARAAFFDVAAETVLDAFAAAGGLA